MYVCICAAINEDTANAILKQHTVEEMIKAIPCIRPKTCGRCLTEFKEIRKKIENDKSKAKIGRFESTPSCVRNC